MGYILNSHRCTVWYSTVQYTTLHYTTVHYSTAQHTTVQYSTLQYSTVQYSTVQYSTVQYSTVQYSAYMYSSDRSAWRNLYHTGPKAFASRVHMLHLLHHDNPCHISIPPRVVGSFCNNFELYWKEVIRCVSRLLSYLKKNLVEMKKICKRSVKDM